MAVKVYIEGADKFMSADTAKVCLPTLKGEAWILGGHESMLIALARGNIIFHEAQNIQANASKSSESHFDESASSYHVPAGGIAHVKHIDGENASCTIVLY